jgi:hypothetical protein
MEGITTSRDARSEIREGTGSEGHEDELHGTSDNPRHLEPGFVAVDDLPGNEMNPEQALLAKEEKGSEE